MDRGVVRTLDIHALIVTLFVILGELVRRFHIPVQIDFAVNPVDIEQPAAAPAQPPRPRPGPAVLGSIAPAYSNTPLARPIAQSPAVMSLKRPSVEDLIAEGWSVRTFAFSASDEGSFDSALPEMCASHGDVSLLQKAALRAAWHMARRSQIPDSSVAPSPSEPASSSEAPSWTEAFAPKMEHAVVQKLKDAYLANYPSELLTPDLMPSLRLPSLVYSQLQKKQWRWIPWKYRMSVTRADEVQGLRNANILEAQQADQKIWGVISDLISDRGWTMDDSLHELTHIRHDLPGWLQLRPRVPKSSASSSAPVPRQDSGKSKGKGKSKKGSSKGKGKVQWITELKKGSEWKQLCMRYQSGNCQLGDACKFTHLCAYPVNGAACGMEHSASTHRATPH
eukprot:s8_g6.t1